MTHTHFETRNADDGLTLYGRSWMPKTPKAIINLVHGLGEHCGRYEDMALSLNARGIGLRAIDLHGHGLTADNKDKMLGQQHGKSRGLCADYGLLRGDVDALLASSKTAAPKCPQVLMGHSMGGGIILSYLQERRDLNLAGAVAQAPLIDSPDRPPAALTALMKLITAIAPKFRIKAKLDGSKVSTLYDEQQKYERDPLNHTYLGGKLAMGLFTAADAIAKGAGEFPDLPLLVTHGTQDVLTDYAASERFATAAGAAFISYPDSAHEVHNDLHRAKVYADLADWVLAL